MADLEKDIKLIADTHAAYKMKELHDNWSNKVRHTLNEFENVYIQCLLLCALLIASIYFLDQKSIYSYVFSGFVAGIGTLAFIVNQQRKRIIAEAELFLTKQFDAMKIAQGAKEELT